MDIRAHTLWAALALMACAGDPPAEEGHTTTSPSGSDSADSTGDTTDGTTGTQESTLVVVVVADPPYPEPDMPAVNAVVALDTSEGRFESTTDAEGRAYFEGFEWNGETVDVTVGAIGYVMRSRLGLSEADTSEAGEIEIEIYAIGVSDSVVEISGPVLDKQADNHDVIASIGGPQTFWDSTSTWSANIAPDTPFFVIALEVDFLDGGPNTVDNPIFGWFTLEHPGVSEDTQLPIDFAMPTQPEYAAGSYNIPQRPDSPLRLNNFGFVYTVARLSTGPVFSQLIGRATDSSVSDDGNTIDYEIEYVTPATLIDPQTCYRVVSQVGYDHSTVCLPGLPIDGTEDIELLDATEVVYVADRSLHDPIEYELYDDDVVPELNISYNGELLWVVIGPKDASSLTVPQPPTGFAAGGVTLELSLSLGRPAPDGDGYEMWVTMEPFSAAG